MKAKLDNRQLTIDVHDLADSLSQEELEIFAQHVVFNEKLFQGVIETLLQGCCWDGDWYIGEMDQRLRLKLLPLMPDVMRELVAQLVTSNAKYASAVTKHESVLRVLLDHWPKEVQKPVDNSSYVRGEYRSFNSKDAEQYIAQRLGDEWEEIKQRHAEHEQTEAEPLTAGAE